MHKMNIEDRKFLLKAAFTALGIRDFSDEIDWSGMTDELFAISWEVHPILWYGIKEGVLPQPAEKYAEVLEKYQLTLRANSVIINSLIDEILHKAEQTGIKICLLKGVSISREYYPEPTLRPMCDIDILIEEGSKKGVDNILKGMGAVFIDSHHAHKRYIFPKTNEIVVEAHTHLINTDLIFQRIFFPEHYLEDVPWSRMIKTDEGGFKLPLSFEYDYLNLHALKEGYARLKWLIDIALIDSINNRIEKNNRSRFTKNVRDLTNDIIRLLIENDYIDNNKCLFWRNAVQVGSHGKARRWEKLLMAAVCAATIPNIRRHRI